MEKRDLCPTVSVIVPAYNAARFLDRCLQSICKQSLRALEILVVDDGSTDNTAKIVAQYSERDPRVILCTHEKNQGLFAARITGVRAARGEYIAFVDPDDEISIDWIRLLYQEAQACNNDITVGQFFYRYPDDRMEYFNLDPLRQSLSLEGEEVFARFMEQEGSFFSWQRLWNKLYSKALWMRAIPRLESFVEQNPCLCVGKDLTLSFALWREAERVSCVCHGAVYFHARGNDKHGKAVSIEEKLGALDRVLTFAEGLLEGRDDKQECQNHLARWRLHRAAFYYEKMLAMGGDPVKSRQTVAQQLSLSEEQIPAQRPLEQDYFYSVVSPVDAVNFERMEQAKAQICSEEIQTVSFDVFDTLVVRPFAQPTDLFMLLNEDFARLCDLNSYVNFSDLRVIAESRARERVGKENKALEDITLDEIYKQLGMDYGVSNDVLDTMKAKEQELELRFCVARRMGKQFFDLAKSQGKRVIICSDMYLPYRTVEAILHKNGYAYDRLYISCEVGVAKWTGGLFSYVQKELEASKSSFLHIGDNLESDVRRARDAGWNSLHLVKTMDVFKNLSPEVYGGEMYQNLCTFQGQLRDGFNAERMFLGYRCALALVANRFYDDPFVTPAKDTDLDANADWIGYFAVGQYLYAVTDWIVSKIKKKNAEKIHFVARDGYLPMEAYREFKKYDPTLPADNYLYLSRKALALTDIYNKVDMQSLIGKFPVKNYSPKKLDQIFSPYYKDGVSTVQMVLGLDDAMFAKKFTERGDYDAALMAIADCLDFEKLNGHRDELRAHFAAILGRNDLLFDIGYSGRAEAVLTPLLGYPVNSLYVHSNSQALNDRARQFGFYTDCFYDYKPTMTGVIREHVFMKQAPSTVGYEWRNGRLEPLFEPERFSATERIMTRILQDAALEFVHDMCEVFNGYRDVLAYRKEDMAGAFEYYQHYSKYTDRKIFAGVIFEDEMGYGKAFSALDFWDYHDKVCHFNRTPEESTEALVQDQKLRDTLMAYPRWKKALCYLILDRKHFKQSLKQWFSKSES